MIEDDVYQILKKDTLNCPKCKTPMYFECFGSMRVKQMYNGKMVYEAYCPNKDCVTKGEHFKVLAPKN